MPLPKDLQKRLADARTDRARHQDQINEFLRMADPTRPRIGDSTLTAAAERNTESDDRFDTTLEEVAEDFASDLIGRVMPRESDWLKYGVEEGVPEEVQAAISDDLKARTQAIFAAIRGSNFYDEAAGEWALDQGHGTSSIVITDPGAGQPFWCEAVGPNQLLIGQGTKGVNFRAREVYWEIGECLAFWPHYNWKPKHRTQARQESTKTNRVRVVMAATLIPDPGGERWKWQVGVDDEIVWEEEVAGRGSCPILVTRWRTRSASAWGIGPLRKAVPNARILDQLNYLLMKNLGKVVDPVVSYEDDNIMNPDAGVSAGTWLPRQQGSKPPEAIGTEGRMDVAYFEESGLQDQIRRAGYQDGPRQKGKTPPTASQWMDEKADTGRRLEVPTGKLYAEGVVAVVERFEYLLIKRGTIRPALAAKGRAVKIIPLNPLAKQQGYQEVVTAQQLLQAGQAIFGPQVMGALVDGAKTLTNMKERLNDDLIELRPDAAAQPLLAAALGAAPAGGGAPADPTAGAPA